MLDVTGDQDGFLPRFRRRINGGVAAAAGAAVGAVFLLITLLTLTRITDTDLFWHLASGDLIRRTGNVPHADPFSFTAYGLPWIDIHWLFQVGVSYLQETGGFGAVTAARSLLIVGLFAFLYRQGRRHAGPVAVGAVLVLVALACQERFLARPELISWWLLAVVIAGIEAAVAAPTAAARRRILWLALPVLSILWVNVQGLFILGPVVVTLAIVATAARRDLIRAVDLLVCLALQASASLLNPFGPAALRVPFEQFFDRLGGASLVSRTIVEFRPTLSGYLVTPAILAFVAWAAIVLLTMLLNVRRLRLFDALLTLATLYVALRARRNIPIFAIATLPLMIRNATEVAAAWRPAPRGVGRRSFSAATGLFLVALGLSASVVSNRFYLRTPTQTWWGVGTIPHYFPEEAARFVTHARLPGQVFHPMAVGGFLLKAWGGDRRVFIDGRNDPFLHGVFETYLRSIASPAAFEEVVQKYQITMVLWSHQRALEAKPLLAWLAGGNGWVLAHLDPGGAVYVRSDLASPSLSSLRPFGTGREPQAIYEELLAGLADRPYHGPPIRESALAEFFSASGDSLGAEFFLRRAIKALPDSASLWHDLGLAQERLGRFDAARDAYLRSAALDPGMAASQGALGALALQRGDLQEAEDRLDRAYRGGARGLQVLLARAGLFERLGKAREAESAWGEAILQAPLDRDVLLDAARFEVRREAIETARDLYGRILKQNPGDAAAAIEAAALLSRIGRHEEALAVARAAATVAAERLRVGPPESGLAGSGWIHASRPDTAESARQEDRRLLESAIGLAEEAGLADEARAWREVLNGAPSVVPSAAAQAPRRRY